METVNKTEEFKPEDWIDTWIVEQKDPKLYDQAIKYLKTHPQEVQVMAFATATVEGHTEGDGSLCTLSPKESKSAGIHAGGTYAIRFCPQFKREEQKNEKSKKLNWRDYQLIEKEVPVDFKTEKTLSIETPFGFIADGFPDPEAEKQLKAQAICWQVIKEIRNGWKPEIGSILYHITYDHNNDELTYDWSEVSILTPLWQELPNRESVEKLIEMVDHETLLLGLFGIETLIEQQQTK